MKDPYYLSGASVYKRSSQGSGDVKICFCDRLETAAELVKDLNRGNNLGIHLRKMLVLIEDNIRIGRFKFAPGSTWYEEIRDAKKALAEYRFR